MKRFYIFTVILFFGGILSVNAYDRITLRNRNVIVAAKVIEVTPVKIIYSNFGGQTTSIPADSVLSISYENGKLEVINDDPADEQKIIQTVKPISSGMNPEVFIFGVSADPSGFALYGPSGSVELTKGKLNSLIHFNFSSLGLLVDDNRKKGFGFGIGFGLNYLWHSRIGIIYIGGMAEYCTWEDDVNRKHGGVAAMNIGYKYIWQSGIYLRAGGCLGAEWPGEIKPDFLIRPNLSFGYNF